MLSSIVHHKLFHIRIDTMGTEVAADALVEGQDCYTGECRAYRQEGFVLEVGLGLGLHYQTLFYVLVYFRVPQYSFFTGKGVRVYGVHCLLVLEGLGEREMLADKRLEGSGQRWDD
ncbi:hypothetical protein FGO68_gene11779 [Halteria grandinella]|uniref:Uncharacterized protein n=1 Tax=Halteria grandinella TaxID=5974 RepID=A0A8J8NMG7_HALGN|nr:hypothetical protein FGO68_gene11779 [Halteria grandinella]